MSQTCPKYDDYNGLERNLKITTYKKCLVGLSGPFEFGFAAFGNVNY